MAKAEWGLKRVCLHCGTRYYDMKKSPPKCPKCGAAFDTDAFVKSRRSRAVTEDRQKKIPQAADPEDIAAIDSDESGGPSVEDADELGEDVDVDDVVEVDDAGQEEEER